MRSCTPVALALAVLAQAQPAFEVASVKPAPYKGQGTIGQPIVRGDTLTAEHASLDALVEFAYNLRDYQLSGGPAWAEMHMINDSEFFAVTAKAAGNPPPSMGVFRQMLQGLLAERFQLKVHHVQKELPVYNLAVGKDGPKLKPSDPQSKLNFRASSRGRYGIRLEITHHTVQDLIDHQLEGYSSRPILDKTGLTAAYDFTLEFVSEKAPAGQDDSEFPSLVTAVQQQLGLKLEPSRAPFDTLVIDQAQRPSQN